jgi:hypothetical protein
MVAGKDKDIVGALTFQDVNVLIDGIGCPSIPPIKIHFLRGNGVNKLIEFPIENVPGQVHVFIKRGAAVLSEKVDSADTGIQAIGKGKIDYLVNSPEGDRRFGAFFG